MVSFAVHLKQLEKEQKNPKVSRRKEIIKIRSETNEKEMKERIAKINKTKNWFLEKIYRIETTSQTQPEKKGEDSNQ